MITKKEAERLKDLIRVYCQASIELAWPRAKDPEEIEMAKVLCAESCSEMHDYIRSLTESPDVQK